MAPNAVEFRLSDCTSLIVQSADVRRIYEALWAISDHIGAISTAALLFDDAQKHHQYREPINLNLAQSNAVREVVDHLANLS
jgi:hypothetical protein